LHLANCIVRTTDDEGWSTLSNGKLLAAAEQAGFEVMLTADLRIRTQQNLAGRGLALVVLSTPAWPIIRHHLPAIAQALAAVPAAGYVELIFPRPVLRRRLQRRPDL
jgi:hypothetical protein